MNEAKKRSLIKILLNGRLTKKRRKAFADLEPVDREIRKQWDESESGFVDLTIKKQIWEKVKARCEYKKSNRVLVVLGRKFAAASVVVVLLIGGLWIGLKGSRAGKKDLIKVEARQSKMYVLPDSTKVWMEPGSSIQYIKDFNKDRKVWLSGNSLFEVSKHEESTFQVYIDRAFIAVKGTCFLVRQPNAEKSEITLFHGKVEIAIESTGQRIVLKPLQRVTYKPNNAEMKIEQIANIRWENGKYNFTDVPLQKLIEIINQMYDSNITLAKDINHESAFNGSIRYSEPLTDVINKICFSLNLHKEERTNKIILVK